MGDHWSCGIGNAIAGLFDYELIACQPEATVPLSLEGMVKLPPGTFLMGSNGVYEVYEFNSPYGHEYRYNNERPVHRVTITRSFYLDQHEVTNEEYKRVMGRSPSPRGFDGPRQPVTNINWREANEYCELIGKRLPTEAEWEYAARGESHTQEYPTLGGEPPTTRQARYDVHHSYGATANVCSYNGSYVLWGGEPICDLAGNVWEWVNDWCRPGCAYPEHDVYDTGGPIKGERRDERKIRRGGSWHHGNVLELRAAIRNYGDPIFKSDTFGFRCAASPPPDPSR